MESSYGPNSADEPSLLYKLQRKIKVFNTNNPLPNRGYNLIACSSKYGLVFVGSPDGILTVYHLKDLIDKECEPQHTTHQLQERPTHVAVSCDQELLAITGGQQLSIYKISNFQNPNPSSLDIRTEVNPSTFVSGLQWNPIIPDNLAMVFYDGTLLVAHIGAAPQLKKVPSKARCLCWSPKGKQLVTGNSDGTLAQYKPDLTPAKNIPAPNLLEGGAPIEALAVYWISTFMFAVVYKNATDNSRPYVTIINTPKGKPAHCLNYEDICYSMGSNRPWYYYLQGIPQWSIIMASSSNSMEIATLGSKAEEVWVQWCQSDEARPELPLTDKKVENFPIGVSIDTCAIHQLPWGENQVLPFMPLLHVLSHNGLLTIFNVINLNKDAPQVCAPPEHLMLPPAAMTSTIPGEAPAPAQPTPAPAAAPAPVQVKAAPQAQAAPPPQQQVSAPPQYSASVINIPKPPSYTQAPATQGYAQPPAPSEQRQSLDMKPPSLPPKAAPASAPPALPVAPKPQTAQQAQENAALKAEQERLNEIKVNQELKNMLVKEVNDFQMELYKFMVKTRETQAKLQRDISSINANFNFGALDCEQLKKEFCLDELRGAIVQLKLELVRACAVVAEARTHAEAKDNHQWTQADPLTTKRVASVKKLAYYVQNQLEQAQKALDYKWNEALARDPKYKPGQRMIRPVLDDVYQPLVKQQEILSRQQAVLRTLKNTLKECDVTPMFKSTSLLRSTPFKNKDPLSKLTKNILNMSIEPEKTKEPLLSSQKLDALRDMLSNHKTVKIKPVNVEMRQHLATMKMNYEKSLQEKAHQAMPVKTPPVVQTHVKPVALQPQVQPAFAAKMEVKQEPKPSPISIPSFTPLGGAKPPAPALASVARTLFTDEPKQDPPKPIQVPQPQAKPVPSAFAPQYSPITPVTPLAPSPSSAVNTRSVLKDLLQNKQANMELAKASEKNDANTFMGQPICSPFAFSSTTSTAAPTATRTTAFTAKPISDINNMFSKFQPQAFVPESKSSFGQDAKPQTFEPKPQAFAPAEAKPQAFAPTETKPLAFAPAEAKPQAFAPTEAKPQAFAPTEAKPQAFEAKTQPLLQEPKPITPVLPSSQSSETGEPEATVTKTITLKPKSVQNDKPITNLFGLKTSTPAPSSIVPDVLKSTQDTKPKPVEKENQPKEETKVIQKPIAEKKEVPKPLATTNKTSIFGAPPTVSGNASTAPIAESKPAETKTDTKEEPEKASEKPAAPTSSASSIFATGNAAVPAAPKPVLKLDTTSKPEPVTPTPTPTETTPSKPSIFSSNSNVSAASVFGAAVASQANNTSQAGSIFASALSTSTPTPASVFGSATQGSIFGSSQTSVFGSTTQPASTTATTKPSVFSTPSPASPTPGSPSSVFGTAVTTSQSGSIFGTSVFATSTTTSPSVFGSSTTSVFGSNTTQASVFGATTSTPSVFSSTATTTQPSLFSSVSTTSAPSAFTATTTQASVFGSTTPTTKTSMFGTSGGSVFAAPAQNASQTSVFGTSTQASSVFGTATATTQASVFGAATTPTTQASVFGSSPATTQPSVFGSSGQPSVFGTPATTTQSSSLFGGAETNLFAAATISTTSAPSQTSGGSIFGGSPSGGSVFGGGNTNVFGGKASFGAPNPTAASIFGGGGATAFGQKPANNFWTGGASNTEGGGFGSTGGGFGQQATTQASSIFGGNTGGSFSTPSPAGQAFGSPQQGVFGSPQQQSGAASAFGGSPVFGAAKSVFGSSATFGSPSGGFGSSFGGFNKSPSSGFGAPAAFGGGATFGGGAAFGSTSPGKVFGGSSPAPAFSSTQSNATFESLANQNTLTFGNLAQQSGQPQQQTPSFNTSPSFTGWRG